jgi:uncharacterized protein (DUF1810 family)
MADPFDLQRFVEAQARNYDAALAELTRGRKTSHWMWYVFPQLAGLGSSVMAQAYAIGSLEEARAYFAHPLLGPRLEACVAALLALPKTTARAVMGSPDDLKLRSSLTLFAQAQPGRAGFAAALDKYFEGVPDPRTLELLGRSGAPAS